MRFCKFVKKIISFNKIASQSVTHFIFLCIKFGEAFDKDLQNKKRQAKLEEKEKKRKEDKK